MKSDTSGILKLYRLYRSYDINLQSIFASRCYQFYSRERIQSVFRENWHAFINKNHFALYMRHNLVNFPTILRARFAEYRGDAANGRSDVEIIETGRTY